MRSFVFLKPDFKKIILLMVITLSFGGLSRNVEFANDRACVNNGPLSTPPLPEWSCDAGLLLLFIALKPLEGFLHYVMGYVFQQPGVYLLTLATVPYYYLLACVLTWGYSRLLKK